MAQKLLWSKGCLWSLILLQHILKRRYTSSSLPLLLGTGRIDCLRLFFAEPIKPLKICWCFKQNSTRMVALHKPCCCFSLFNERAPKLHRNICQVSWSPLSFGYCSIHVSRGMEELQEEIMLLQTVTKCSRLFHFSHYLSNACYWLFRQRDCYSQLYIKSLKTKVLTSYSRILTWLGILRADTINSHSSNTISKC